MKEINLVNVYKGQLIFLHANHIWIFLKNVKSQFDIYFLELFIKLLNLH